MSRSEPETAAAPVALPASTCIVVIFGASGETCAILFIPLGLRRFRRRMPPMASLVASYAAAPWLTEPLRYLVAYLAGEPHSSSSLQTPDKLKRRRRGQCPEWLVQQGAAARCASAL